MSSTDSQEPTDHDPNVFSIIAAHDLKEPVHGIRAYCESLIEDYHYCLDDMGRHRLKKLVHLCDRLDRMIGDLVSYGRVAYQNPNVTEFDLHVALEELLELLEPSLAKRGASVHVVDRLPIVRGDATMLSLALANLISNGLKFNLSPQPCVEIGLSSCDPPTIYVRDNGIGIPAEHHETIFGLFKRLHGRSKYEGSGAGLTIVRRIIHAHGGRIWLESTPPRGTTFHFTLQPAATKRRRVRRHRVQVPPAISVAAAASQPLVSVTG